MGQIEARAREVQTYETNSLLEASRTWRLSRWVTLATTAAALVASSALMILLMRQALRQRRSRKVAAAEPGQRQSDLERLVARRTEEFSELSTHLQSMAEKEKSLLSRELHDELGGLLIAARMDVSWIEDRVASGDPEVQQHFRRVHEALQAGVDLKRRVVENLRPSLLDNLGLFAALRWQVADSCGRAGMRCLEHYPQEDLPLSPEAAITVFRIVQEALNNILRHARARTVEITVETRDAWLLVHIRDDGVGLAPERLQALGSHGLAAMRHRARGLGGHWQMRQRPEGGTEIEVRLPLERIVVAAPGAASSADAQ
jgi:signal transduction histidine kinase